ASLTGFGHPFLPLWIAIHFWISLFLLGEDKGLRRSLARMFRMMRRYDADRPLAFGCAGRTSLPTCRQSFKDRITARQPSLPNSIHKPSASRSCQTRRWSCVRIPPIDNRWGGRSPQLNAATNSRKAEDDDADPNGRYPALVCRTQAEEYDRDQ